MATTLSRGAGSPPAGGPRRGRHTARRRSRWRTGLVVGLLSVAAAVASVAAVTFPVGPHPAAGEYPMPGSGQPTATASVASEVPPAVAPLATGPATATEPAVARAAESVLRLSGPFPTSGPGTFSYAPGAGPVLGREGSLQRFRVAVENGSGEDVGAFAEAVESALGDPGSWTASGRLRLQRVPGSAPHDFTVYLATAITAGQMCLAGGVNIRVGGRPYTSCRASGKVIINLERWRLSVDHLVRARVPLATYRTYVVNHEVGHQLGRHHEGCPRAGRPAPVMMQQTLFLNGCTVNPWPYLDGRRYDGPPV